MPGTTPKLARRRVIDEAVVETIDRLSTVGLVSDETKARPPARQATVVRRALRQLPKTWRCVFVDAGLDKVTARERVDAVVELLVALVETPEEAVPARWLETVTTAATMATGDPMTGFVVAAELIGRRSELLSAAMTSVFSPSDGLLPGDFAVVIACWMHAIRQGYAAPSWLAAEAAALYSRHLEVLGLVVPACDLIDDAVHWLRPETVALDLVDTPDAVDPSVWESDFDWVAIEIHHVRLLAVAGRWDEVIANAGERRLDDRVALQGDDARHHRMALHTALAQAHAALDELDVAIEHADWVLFEAECAYGPGSTEALEAANKLTPLYVRAGNAERALEVAAHAHDVACTTYAIHPELEAQCALHHVMALRTVGRREDAREVALEAAEVADDTLGPVHPVAQMLRTMGNSPRHGE